MVIHRAVLMTVVGLAALASQPVLASIIFVGPEVLGGSGFGALPRALTVQSHSPAQSVESGCIAPDGSGGVIAGNGACAPGHGNIGGDEQNPFQFPKQEAPSLSSLGITNANQIAILFDGVQPQNANNDVVTSNDLTLKLYSGTTLLVTASGSFSNLATNPGNGNTDYLFRLDDAEAAEFNAAIAGNFSDRIALDSTISFPRQSAGPDSYALVNINSLPGAGIESVPETKTKFMIGFGLICLGLAGRRKMRASELA